MNSQSILEYLHLPIELLRVIVILLLAWFLMGLSGKLIRMFRDYMHTPESECR